MSRKMLINTVHPEEARVAIVEDGRLVELDVEIEGSEQTRGNVYKGVVVRVEPGLQAAFVDIGLKKLGFLQVGELHPDCWQWRDDVPEESRKRRPRIQEVLRRGQELLVQVEKGERDMKGAALTTYLSLPGRYMVLMPGSDSAGISRKVESEADRKTLKEMASELEIPEGIGYIIRTEALGKKKTELTKDFQSLLKLHKEIVTKGTKTKAPALIYQESGLVIRTIRDYFTAEIDEVLVDNADVFKQAQDFFKRTMPKFQHVVKLHQEKRPIFSKYQLEEQIDDIYEKKVQLKSGGSLIIEPTEALVSIDVNSGKTTGEKGVEDTAFKTNVEAAEEVARQLRLRDLGGLIVIDFIDMREKRHNSEVEKTLKNALKADKARVTVGRISQFGMLEMSRQRIKQTLDQGSVLECPHCSGRGKVKSAENMAISFLRKVHAAAAKGTVSEVRGALPLEVAYYLLNRKKRELVQIETDYDIEVTVKGKPSFLMNQLDVEHIKRERPANHVDHQEQVAESIPAGVPAEKIAEVKQSPRPGEEPKTTQKRRRGKKGKEEGEAAELLQPIELQQEVEARPLESVLLGSESEEPEEAVVEEHEEHAEAHKKKRRRRKKRGKSQGAETAAPTEETASAPEADEQDLSPDETSAETLATVTAANAGLPEGAKKKRRRRRRRGKGATSLEQAAAGTHPVTPEGEAQGELSVAPPTPVQSQPEATTSEPETGATTAPPAKPARKRPSKKPAQAPELVPEPAPIMAAETPAPVSPPDLPVKPARRKKTAAPKATAEGSPAEAPTGATKPARPTRKKKDVPPSESVAPPMTPLPVQELPPPAAVPPKKPRVRKPAAE